MNRRNLFTRFFSLLGIITAGAAAEKLVGNTGTDQQGMPETPVTDRKWRLATREELRASGVLVFVEQPKVTSGYFFAQEHCFHTVDDHQYFGETIVNVFKSGDVIVEVYTKRNPSASVFFKRTDTSFVTG